MVMKKDCGAIISSKSRWPAGTAIQGKWNGRRYDIHSVLGEGANGIVYLACTDGKWVALKTSHDSVDLQVEINAIERISQGASHSRFRLIDVDDFELNGQSYPFYVMPYFKGKHLSVFMKSKGWEWFGPVGEQILQQLCRLHQRKYIFGDLKPANILVDAEGRAQLIDFGGVGQIGKSVKQFTEIYDRGYWNGGSRTADDAYDLFSFAALAVHLLDPERKMEQLAKQIPQNRHPSQLIKRAQEVPELRPFAAFIDKAIRGKYSSSGQALQEWKELMHKHVRYLPFKGEWLKKALIVSVIFFISVLWIVTQTS
ncbi:serine/threonine protein kinase [Marinicrinis lubricantis]|uniref:Serine/threonine protein kinase n=1 Tax=Marinicrinis lubricantis TaxID=2086470 RepID=A0ABW1IPV1_9BACL